MKWGWRRLGPVWNNSDFFIFFSNVCFWIRLKEGSKEKGEETREEEEEEGGFVKVKKIINETCLCQRIRWGWAEKAAARLPDLSSTKDWSCLMITHTHTYIYIYISVCVCVCVCVTIINQQLCLNHCFRYQWKDSMCSKSLWNISAAISDSR